MRAYRCFPGALAAVALTLAASGCGDSVGPTTITLSNAEVSELFSEVGRGLSGGGVNLQQVDLGGPAILPAASDASSPADNINTTVNCPAGGTVGVAGTVNGSGSSATFDLTETFNSCKTTHFTVGGSLNLSGKFSGSQTSLTFEETGKGNLTVSHNTDGRSGTCGIDFKVTGSFSQGGAFSVSASGTICGIEAKSVVSG